MLEKEMQRLLWEHPQELLKEQLTRFDYERRSAIGRLDLIFTDRHDNFVIIEIKLGTLKRGAAIDQLQDYYGMIRRDFPSRSVELMVVANHIPEERKLACGRSNIEPREISERRFREVAAQVGYVFESEISSVAKEPDQVIAMASVFPVSVVVTDNEHDSGSLGSADKPPDDATGPVDRQYWELHSSALAMELFDRFKKILADRSIPLKWTFRRDGIAFGGKWNFAYVTPQKSGRCLLRFYNRFYRRIPEDALKAWRDKLEQAGVPVQRISHERFSVSLETKTMENNAEIFVELICRVVKLGGG